MKNASLSNLKDLNIIVGPNNSGKSSLLKAINILSRLNIGGVGSFVCKSCGEKASLRDYIGLQCSLDEREKFKNKAKVEIAFKFNDNILEEVLSLGNKRYLREESQFLKKVQLSASEHPTHVLTLKEKKKTLYSEHIYRFMKTGWAPIIQNKIFSRVLFCPEERLQVYKKKSLDEFLKEKDIEDPTIVALKTEIKEIIDFRISKIRTSTMSLVLDLDNEDYVAKIAEQGTGVKSLICLIADILTSPHSLILLIDEPELGLNPSGKKAFLKFLLDQARSKQVFIATHDPTFLNPVIWKTRARDISAHLYSYAKEGFVTLNLDFNKEDPACFAGFLPHTTSKKEYHIYVEGTFDVYVFQVFLERFLKKNFEDYDRCVLKNKIGIFHLGGDEWEHFIDTIPSSPFKLLVILDGDKKPTVAQKLEKGELPRRLKLIEDIDDLFSPEYFADEEEGDIPIYCLRKKEIEKYLKPKPKTKKQNVKVSLEMKQIPPEIEKIFSNFLSVKRII